MIIDALITIWYYMITIFLGILSPLFSAIDVIIPYDISTTIGIVFGNTLLFDSFLPVTEAYVLAGVALTLKLAVFSYKVIWVIIDFTKYVSSYIKGIRM